MLRLNLALALGVILVILAAIAAYNSWNSTYADFTTGLLYRAMAIVFMAIGIFAIAYSRVLKGRLEEISQF